MQEIPLKENAEGILVDEVVELGFRRLPNGERGGKEAVGPSREVGMLTTSQHSGERKTET